MSEPFIGQIVMFGGTFAPRGWAFCNGQLLSIAQNSALFAILGVTYGGNGQTTFALPNMQSRVPIHPGQGPGLSYYDLGQVGGSETVTLNTQQMPAHVHPGFVNATSEDATGKSPINSVMATTQNAIYGPSTAEQGASFTTGIAGGTQPHPNIQPYLCVNFIIATQGIFPVRN